MVSFIANDTQDMLILRFSVITLHIWMNYIEPSSTLNEETLDLPQSLINEYNKIVLFILNVKGNKEPGDIEQNLI